MVGIRGVGEPSRRIVAGVLVYRTGGFGGGLTFDPTFLPDPPLWYRLLLVLPVLATVGTVVSIGSAAVAWRSGAWSRRSLFHYSIVALSTGVACWLLYYWNLFGTPG